MLYSNLSLKEALNADAVKFDSVEISDKKFASKYFGTWGKGGATPADVVSWCNEQIEARKLNLVNLEALKQAAQLQMVNGLDVETLRAILAQKTQAA